MLSESRERALEFASSPATAVAASHNTVGQRLGRKGQATRERILAAMLRLLDDHEGPPITLTSVAREAKVGLTNLYLYFPDLGELLLAALAHVMATAEEAYGAQLRQHWPDETLEQSCKAFVLAHYGFWKRHARLLHLRNAMADAGDIRVMAYRQGTTRPLIDALGEQLSPAGIPADGQAMDIATVLFTGLERLVTVVTHSSYRVMADHFGLADTAATIKRLIAAECHVMTLAIRERRQATRPQT